jgi:cytochrome c oxidase subunit 4
MSHSHAHSHSHEELGHVVPERTFLNILLILLSLTVVTVLAAKLDMGKWNIVGALAIASIKASFVILVFMHGKYENKILWTYIIIPFVLLVIMIGGVFSDDTTRDHPVPFGATASEAAAPVAAHAGHH